MKWTERTTKVYTFIIYIFVYILCIKFDEYALILSFMACIVYNVSVKKNDRRIFCEISDVLEYVSHSNYIITIQELFETFNTESTTNAFH